MNISYTPIDEFYALSVVLTGFSLFELRGTGMGQCYFDVLCQIGGEAVISDLLQRFHTIDQECHDDLVKMNQALRTFVFSDPKMGPLVRNIIKLWYLGSWYQLPEGWRDTYGISVRDVTFVVSPQAYVEGLVWQAMDTHPMGAKEPGYATWSMPPEMLHSSSALQ